MLRLCRHLSPNDVISLVNNAMDTEWTNEESSRSKAFIASIHYTNDSFAQLFAQPLKRTPEINRGYYARSSAVNHLIRQFCRRESPAVSVVQIGAGFDALFWRLNSEGTPFARVVDVDTDHVIGQKVRQIQRHSTLREPLGGEDVRFGQTSCHSPRYHAVAVDATKGRRLARVLHDDCAVAADAPVVFVFECVLLYWSRDQTGQLLHTLATTFKKAAFVAFDLLQTNDTFAHVMQQSLQSRDTPLLGAQESNTLDDWRQKFVQNGVPFVQSWNMNEVYAQLLPREDRARAERLEFLDETELLDQLLSHYCLVFASNFGPVFW